MAMLDGVTLNQLRTFVAVCDEGSFSGAARRLLRAQSAVSHAVAALEATLDVDLFERGARRTELSSAGRDLLVDARAVIARTEEMKSRAGVIARLGVPRIALAVDVYFPRAHLIECLKRLQAELPTAAVSLRLTTMQEGEALVANGTCALAVTVADVPEVDGGVIERHWLGEVNMLTVCAPAHPLAQIAGPTSREEFARYPQLVMTDNQADAEKSQMSVAGERQWRVDDLSAKQELLRGGLCWGHMPAHLVADDLAAGRLVELERRAWHLRPLTFMISRRRGQDLCANGRVLVERLGAVRFGEPAVAHVAAL
jgi:DNA-binding transcriptional LysR family regulator